jgi:hypothetical protein
MMKVRISKMLLHYVEGFTSCMVHAYVTPMPHHTLLCARKAAVASYTDTNAIANEPCVGVPHHAITP